MTREAERKQIASRQQERGTRRRANGAGARPRDVAGRRCGSAGVPAAADVLALQRAVGNRTTRRYLGAEPPRRSRRQLPHDAAAHRAVAHPPGATRSRPPPALRVPEAPALGALAAGPVVQRLYIFRDGMYHPVARQFEARENEIIIRLPPVPEGYERAWNEDLDDWVDMPTGRAGAPMATGAPLTGREAVVGPIRVLPVEVLEHILSFMDERDLMALRLVSTLFQGLATRILTRYFTAVTGFSSELVETSLKDVVKGLVRGAPSLKLSVDQISDQGFLDDVLGSEDIPMQLNIGRLKSELDPKYAVKQIALQGGAKMHNKFWVVGPSEVITGSPNVTFSGYTQNVETMVHIRSSILAALFRRYFSLMRQGFDQQQADSMSGALEFFNNDNRGLRVALSPFLPIQDFVLGELEGATHITVRMFLVSFFENKDDIVGALRTIADLGVTVDIVVDAGQFKSASYVRKALGKLKGSGVRIFVQSKKKPASRETIMHDKLILVDRGPDLPGRVIIGSAGFSQNVMNNLNYENMVSIDSDALYQYFILHHLDSMVANPYISTEDVGGKLT